jgi:MtrB/PioB family decaheme-associated outer membrane protein
MTSNRRPPLALRASVIAVQGALALFGVIANAQTAEPTVQDLVTPTSVIEAGGIYVDKSNAKAAEYNGLQHQGLNPNAGFDLRGGGAYDSGSNERWRVYGSNLGLDIRNIGGDYARQGQFRFKIDYDELRRNFSDDYKTLWNGAGTSTLTLPAGYPSAAARAGSSGLFNLNNIQAPNLNATTTGGGPGFVIPALMHTENIGTTRKRTALGTEVILSPQWTVAVNARNEKKEGTKLTGSAMGGFKGALLPEPINSDTNIVDAVARYVTKQAHFSLGYSASFYRNHVDGWTAEYPFSTGSAPTLNNLVLMNGAPDNQMHQIVLDGGYHFSPTTKLVMSGSYTRMTQNEPFHFQGGPGWDVNGGATSSNSKEIQTNFLARLTTRPMTGLDLTAAFKVDNRDNRSPVGQYKIAVADEVAIPSLSTTFRNVPLNRKQWQANFDSAYTYSRGQVVSAGIEHVNIERTADTSIDPLSHEINNPFASGKATENTVKLGYRQTFNDAVSGQLTYARSQRRAHDYEEPEPVAPGGSANVGAFAEVPGFRQFFLADRNRDKLRAAVDFQASEKLFVQTGVDYLKDKFPSKFGLKNSGGPVFNLDGTYTANDKLTFNAFFTAEDLKSHQEQFQLPVARASTPAVFIAHSPDGSCAPFSNAAGTLPSDYLTDPCRNWSFSQADRVFTFGAGAKTSQFMGGRLTLSGDIVYARARTSLDFSGGTYYSNGLTSNVYIPAQSMPNITSTSTDLKLGARYQFDKQSAIRVGYLHRRLRSSDPQFDLFGITSVQAYIGPGIKSPNFDVNAVSISYVYTFR